MSFCSTSRHQYLSVSQPSSSDYLSFCQIKFFTAVGDYPSLLLYETGVCNFWVIHRYFHSQSVPSTKDSNLNKQTWRSHHSRLLILQPYGCQRPSNWLTDWLNYNRRLNLSNACTLFVDFAISFTSWKLHNQWHTQSMAHKHWGLGEQASSADENIRFCCWLLATFRLTGDCGLRVGADLKGQRHRVEHHRVEWHCRRGWHVSWPRCRQPPHWTSSSGVVPRAASRTRRCSAPPWPGAAHAASTAWRRLARLGSGKPPAKSGKTRNAEHA